MMLGETVLPTPADKFWVRVKVSDMDSCWPWEGRVEHNGYGRAEIRGRRQPVHRWAWEFSGHPPVPEGLVMDHLCRNRACCNPRHLEVVEQRENNLRGVGLTAVLARQTECIHGHPFDAANTYLRPGKYSIERQCRTCRAAAVRRYVARRRLSC